MTGSGFDDWSVKDARDWLRSRIDGGDRCPCCTQFAKVYRRRINAGMVRALVSVYHARAKGDGFLHASMVRSHEIAQLSWWGLIEEEPVTRDDGGRAGWWRITPAGVDWLYGRISVPKYAHIYDGRLLKLDGDPLQASVAVGKKFDLRELMGWT